MTVVSHVHILERFLEHLLVRPIDIRHEFLLVLFILLLVIRYKFYCLPHLDVLKSKFELPLLEELVHLLFLEPGWHLELLTPVRLVEVSVQS